MASKPPFLRIVRPEDARPLAAEDFAPQTWQSNLFASTDPSQIIFVNVELLDERDFLTVLIASRMRFVIDLRQAPRFDIGSLNRRLVFGLFEKSAAKYIDVAGRLGITDHRDARLNPAILGAYLREQLSDNGRLGGPIVFFVDAPHFSDEYMFALAAALPADDDRGWAPLRVPVVRPTEMGGRSAALTQEAVRRLVFISHANPEDNSFTRWLATQLSSNGYLVWSDITNLLGGEEFWDGIEDAIRIHARKVIVVLSRAAQTKKGVLDEINCAVMAERSLGLDGYVVPIRIDDLPFSEIRANLARKNVIDFKGNWAQGLKQLLKVLERDGVPKDAQGTSRTVSWYQATLARPSALQHAEEKLVSNWFEILQLPTYVLLHSPNNTPAFDQLAKGVKIPHFKYYRLVGSFAPAHEFQSELPSDLVFEERYRIGLPDFLKGRPPEMPGAGPADTHRIAISLIRQAWNLTASSRGLLPFETASGSLAWYAPKGVVQGDKVSFTDSNGVARRKTLVGWSAKRAVHWHFAVEMKPSLGPQPHLTARSHVIFTLDGRLPLENKAKMHSLRRSFCRSWWNDRWRDLLLAFAWWISGGAKTFNLMTGGADPLIVSAKPMQMISPISLFELRDREIMSPDEEDVDWDDPDIESDELLGDEVDEPGSDDGALPE